MTDNAKLIQTQGWVISASMKNAPLRAHLLKATLPDDFLGIDRELFAALGHGAARLDPLAFTQALSPEGNRRLLDIEADYLSNPDTFTFGKWVKDITDAAEGRAIRKELKLADQRLGNGDNAEVVMGDLMVGTLAARARSQGETMVSMSEAVPRVKALMKRYAAGEEHVETVPTMFADLDAKLGGMERRHIATLAGGPGQGKTQMALQISRNVALRALDQKRDAVVIIFSAEMTVERLVLRLASSSTGISAKAIRQNTAGAQEAARYMKALDEMAGLPIKVDETPSPTTLQMLNRVAMEALLHKDGIDLVVFDYLELAGDKAEEKEEARLGGIMRGLKIIAKRFNCPVLVLSQLSREHTRRATRIPELPDLRGSSWIEALSQQVLFITRPDAYATKDERTGRLNYETEALAKMAEKYGQGAAFIKIAKNRDGEVDMVVMKFKAGATQFSEKADNQPAPKPPAPPYPPRPTGTTHAALSQKEEAA